jgi:hypothetical protein
MAVNVAGQTLSGNSPKADSPKMAVRARRLRRNRHHDDGCRGGARRLHSQDFMWENETDRVKGEWKEGMAADSCIKTVAAGTRTLEVTGGNHGITVCDSDGTANTSGRYVSIAQNATLALILASKTCGWIAQG